MATGSLRKTLFILAIAVLGGLAAACSRPREQSFAGRTMGTTYHIKVVADSRTDPSELQAQVDALLEQINQSMSTFRPQSEISRFNASRAIGTPFEISPHFLRVMLLARELYDLTEGAWDATVDPLVNLWGFGAAEARVQEPAAAELERVRKQVGFDAIDVVETGALVKKRPDVTIDLASVAKGYGVDQVALLLKGKGFKDFLVEIGGEVYAGGKRPDGTAWRVGINEPRAEAAADAVYKVLALADGALATSGDYRNFYRVGDRLVSHIIDPRTGYPMQNGVVSASVAADNCALADGLATALMVLGPRQGIDLLNRLDGVEGLIVVREPDGRLTDYWSEGLRHLDVGSRQPKQVP